MVTLVLMIVYSEKILYFNPSVFFINLLVGKRACTINIHNACKHLTSSVRLAGPLWAFSCFGFEGWNGVMTKLIHGTHHVATQVIVTLLI